MRRFYAPKEHFQEGSVKLSAEESRHMRDVLRLRPGSAVSVFDGEGTEFLANIRQLERSFALLTVVEKTSPKCPESDLDLTLAAAILKGEKFDMVVQKAVELGVKTLVPLRTLRGDVKLRDEARRTDRWRKIAIEASKQTGRATLMKISEPAEFASVVNDNAGKAPVVMFTERDGNSLPEDAGFKRIIALVGPEGGWDDSEIGSARDAGAILVTLGGRILRAETAAIAVTAILEHRFGDIR